MVPQDLPIQSPEHFSIYSANGGIFKELDFSLRHGCVTAVSGEGATGKTTLLRSIIHGYSVWLLEQTGISLTTRTHRRAVPLVGSSAGVLPTLLLNELFESLPLAHSLGSFLGLDTLLSIATEEIGRPYCADCGCGMEDFTTETVVPKVLKSMGRVALERPMALVGAEIRLKPQQFISALRHYIAEGYSRFLINGRGTRLSLASLESLFPTLPDTPVEVIVFQDSLSQSEATAGKIAAAIASAQKIEGGVARVLVASAAKLRFDGEQLDSTVDIWTSRDGFVCPKCGRFQSASASDTMRMVAGFSTPQLSSVSLATLLEALRDTASSLAAALLKRRLKRLEPFSISELSLEMPLGNLPPSVRFTVLLAKLAEEETSGRLLLLDCPERVLGSAAAGVLAPWFRSRIEAGNSVLVASNSPDVIELASDRWTLTRSPHSGAVELSPMQSPMQRHTQSTAATLVKKKSRALEFESTVAASKRISVPHAAITVLLCSESSTRSLLLAELEERAKAADFRAIRRVSAESVSGRPLLASELCVLELIRLDAALAKLFSDSRAARVSGMNAASFDRRGAGGCDRCKGSGETRVELDLLGMLTQPCSRCGGSGFDARVSEIVVRGFTIAEAMSLTLAAARAKLPLQRSAARKLELFERLGLGEIALRRRASELAESERSLFALGKMLLIGKRSGSMLLVNGVTDMLDSVRLAALETECFRYSRGGPSVVFACSRDPHFSSPHQRIEVSTSHSL